jgi:glutaredoxin
VFNFLKNLLIRDVDEEIDSNRPNNFYSQEPFDLEVFKMDEVKVYALSTCIHCKNAKKYLDECGVKYNCVYVDELKGDTRKEVVKELKGHNPAVSFPTIVIKDKVVVGYHKDKIDKALKSED